MNRKLTSLALASAGLLAITLPGVSHADVMASAMLNMTNFMISDADGQLDASQFSFLTYTISADQSASLNGTTLSNSASGTTLIDFAPICVGGGCAGLALVDNSFPKLTAPPTPGNYAAADQLDSGSPITGTALGNDPSHVAAASYAGLTEGTAEASVDANNNFNSSFIFGVSEGGLITFSFDLDAWLQVAVTADENFPGFATAAVDMSFSIVDLSNNSATVLSYTPDIFGDGIKTLSLNAPLPVDIESTRNLTDGFFTTTTLAPLVAGNLYQASFRMNTNADTSRVPEPGVLALVGLGLVGLGLTRRRKASV